MTVTPYFDFSYKIWKKYSLKSFLQNRLTERVYRWRFEVHRVLQVWRSIGSGPGVGRGISEIWRLTFSKTWSRLKFRCPVDLWITLICYCLYSNLDYLLLWLFQNISVKILLNFYLDIKTCKKIAVFLVNFFLVLNNNF